MSPRFASGTPYILSTYSQRLDDVKLCLVARPSPFRLRIEIDHRTSTP